MILGAIADDLTGASDLALMLSREGMATTQLIGLPDPGFDFGDAEAVVVSLKSRTIPAADAVAQSLAATRALLKAGAEQLFFKYCSTFDSTDAGNIGPVAEAMLDLVGGDFTIACPAFPANGRTVYKGHLFVGDQLLSDSPMKDHPLTPMRDANLVRVLQRQTRLPVGLVDAVQVEGGPESVVAAFAGARADGNRIVIVDAISDRDLRTIGMACAGMKLVTGGSGVAMGLPENYRIAGTLKRRDASAEIAAPTGRAIILAGSCSAATRGQLKTAIAAGIPAFRIDPLAVAAGKVDGDRIASWVAGTPPDKPALVYSSAEPAEVEKVQAALGRSESGDLVEKLLADVAMRLPDLGVTRFVVAGGETSGAVVSALGVKAMQIGPEIDPGVPWMRSIGAPNVAMALKSGNFGAPDFFLKAWRLLSEDGQ